MTTRGRRKLDWQEIRELEEIGAVLRENGIVITGYTTKEIRTYGNNSGAIRWRNDGVTRSYLREHDFSRPSSMTVRELADALTYMAANQFGTLLARQICIQGRTESLYDFCRTEEDRRTRVMATLRSFGITLV